MKKIKMTTAVIALSAAVFTGYTAYEQATMTDQERLILANIEALTSGDEPVETTCSGGSDGQCYTQIDTDYVYGILPIPMPVTVCGWSGYTNDYCVDGAPC